MNLEWINSISLVLIISISFVSCGEEENSEEDKNTSTINSQVPAISGASTGVTSNGENTAYQGAWSFGCQDSSDEYSTSSNYSELVFNGNTMLTNLAVYASSDCTGVITMQDTSSFYYSLSTRSSGDGQNIDLMGVQQVRVYNTQEQVDAANSNSDFGYAGWELEVPHTLDASNYEFFSLININADGKLCFGESDVDDVNTGYTAESRHKSFQTECRFKQ